MPSTAVDVIAVAVGILEDAHGRILVGRRPDHKHQGGKWEFPGGKIELGETMPAALARELHEELGINLQAACPMLRVRHQYPDQNVLLDVWRVTEYTGEPHGREGQSLRWVDTAELAQLDLPSADIPILRALQLPTFYLITDSQRYGKSEMLARIERALRAGAQLLQIREPHLSAEEYLDYARTVCVLAHRYGARVLLNAEAALVESCEADGVHLSSRRLMSVSARPLPVPYLVSASCHDATELAQAERVEADFALLSPVLPTASHPGAKALGWEHFAQLRLQSDIPVYALGVMQPQHFPQARSHGGQGVAMIGGIWEAASIETALASLRCLRR